MKYSMPRNGFSIILFLSLLFAIGCGSKATRSPASASDIASDVHPKDATAYVCTPASDDLRLFLLKFAFNQEAEITDSVRSVLVLWAVSNPSGSGALIEHDGDYSLVATNYHVAMSGRPYLSFDEGQTMIRGTVLHNDIENDITIIEMPKRDGGLRLASSYADSQKVEAYGFPGLGLKGNFQISSGLISNACIHKSVLVENGGDMCLIQHTAAIDSGSSGGPLITRAGLIGINEGFIANRHEVGFAIPVELVRVAIREAERKRGLRKDPEASKKELLKTCSRFGNDLSSLNPKMSSILPLFSEQLIIGKGQEALENYPVRDINVFKQNPTFNTVAAIGSRLQTLFQENKGMSGLGCVLDSTELLSKEGVQATIMLNSGLRLNTKWTFGGNGWNLVDY
jgi:S1-C subfamily serine protease